MDLVNEQISKEFGASVKFENMKLIIDAEYEGKYLSNSNVTKVPVTTVLEALKKAIPGTVDDALITLLENALSKV